MYNPIIRADEIRQKVINGNKRRYYRLVRGGQWYGGIATADCCGCNLKCVFCWSNFPRDNPDKCGRFYPPEEVFRALVSVAKRRNYNQLRISGNEPTLTKEHLLELLTLIDKTDYRFILETNGTLIDTDFAQELKKFDNLSVRVSVKGTNPEEFSLLTGAVPEGFNLQIEALRNLLSSNIHCWLAVVLSFSPKESYQKFKKIIREISPKVEIEEECIFLLPHIQKRLKEAGIKPLICESVTEAIEKECK
ncbi:MAG: radical SAM protein [Elusimicrobiota bacterium]